MKKKTSTTDGRAVGRFLWSTLNLPPATTHDAEQCHLLAGRQKLGRKIMPRSGINV